ncbi:hypothetical protein [Saccharothrix sp. HUAS TT1]|uniref:hypothetical protein n=1 Tax=unclassified Saccharothrix TaxID=2593673 RepID=UPI00345BC8DC
MRRQELVNMVEKNPKSKNKDVSTTGRSAKTGRFMPKTKKTTGQTEKKLPAGSSKADESRRKVSNNADVISTEAGKGVTKKGAIDDVEKR